MAQTPHTAGALTSSDTPHHLIEKLSRIVGVDHVLADRASREFASIDLFPDEGHHIVELVVRPGSTEEVAEVVALLNQEDLSIIPRAAGLSYAGGAVAHSRAMAIDTRRLKQISVYPEDRYAVVGAGCTWTEVAAALRPHNLKTTQPSPISGSHSTVGGTAAQGIPGGTEGIIGVTVVLPDGTIARTGSGMRVGSARFFRYNGPDLTGIFLGDCGAFGVKTEIVLRLSPTRAAAFASLGFETSGDAVQALCDVAATGLVSRALVLDPTRNAQIGGVSISEAINTASALVANAQNWRRALQSLFRIRRDRQLVNSAAWSLHLTCEAATEAAAEAQLKMAISISRLRGREVGNLVPQAIHARPYTIAGFLGPENERWVPVHGVLPLSRARACFQALRDHVTARARDLRNLDIEVGWLLAASGPYVTIESMFYWRDMLNAVHLTYLSQRARDHAKTFQDNPTARAFVARMRIEHRDIMDRYDAVHAQIARLYPFFDSIDAGSRSLLARIKNALDPNARMNTGNLGLKGPAHRDVNNC